VDWKERGSLFGWGATFPLCVDERSGFRGRGGEVVGCSKVSGEFLAGGVSLAVWVRFLGRWRVGVLWSRKGCLSACVGSSAPADLCR